LLLFSSQAPIHFVVKHTNDNLWSYPMVKAGAWGGLYALPVL